MVTYYNEKDLVSFGNFLLSDERKQNKIASRDEMIRQGMSPPPIETFMDEVGHADIENWKFEDSLRKSKNFLKTLGVSSQVIFCRAPSFMFNSVTGQISYVPEIDEPGFYHTKIETFRNITAQALKDQCAGCWCLFYLHDNSKLMTNEMGVIENLQATFIPRKAEADCIVEQERFIVIPMDMFDQNMPDNPNFTDDINGLIDQTCLANDWTRADEHFQVIAEGTLPPKACFKIR